MLTNKALVLLNACSFGLFQRCSWLPPFQSFPSMSCLLVAYIYCLFFLHLCSTARYSPQYLTSCSCLSLYRVVHAIQFHFFLYPQSISREYNFIHMTVLTLLITKLKFRFPDISYKRLARPHENRMFNGSLLVSLYYLNKLRTWF